MAGESRLRTRPFGAAFLLAILERITAMGVKHATQLPFRSGTVRCSRPEFQVADFASANSFPVVHSHDPEVRRCHALQFKGPGQDIQPAPATPKCSLPSRVFGWYSLCGGESVSIESEGPKQRVPYIFPYSEHRKPRKPAMGA